MNDQTINVSELTHVKIACMDNVYVATLIDHQHDEILKGYGSSIVLAINDLHHNMC